GFSFERTLTYACQRIFPSISYLDTAMMASFLFGGFQAVIRLRPLEVEPSVKLSSRDLSTTDHDPKRTDTLSEVPSSLCRSEPHRVFKEQRAVGVILRRPIPCFSVS